MIAGLDPVSEGEVLIDGARVDGVPPSARDVAMVFQGNVLYPHLTVAENIGFALRLAKLDRHVIDDKVREIAGLLQLTPLLDRFPAQLSGGQQQRAAMGRAIVRTPRVLLMDEPMSNLDAKLRTEMRFEILALHQMVGVTTVYVTHDQIEALAMGDRAAVMRDGRIVQCGSPIELYEHPVDLFVAQFIGSPPMNVVEARVEAGDGRAALRVGAHRLELDDTTLSRAPGLIERAGRRVGLGFRPESLRRDENGPLVVSPTWTEHRGVDQLVSARIDAPRVAETDAGVVVGDDPGSTIHVSLPAGDVVDIWKPLPLTLDTGTITLFDLATGAALDRRQVSTTCRAPTTSGAR
jgi:multiple sugar transport system ATP-binding protein